MPLLLKGELRAYLERDVPGALDHSRTPASKGAATNFQQIQEMAANTGTDTTPTPGDADAATERGAEESEAAPAGAPPLFEDDAVVVAERLPDVALYLRDEHGYGYLSRVMAIDYPAYELIEVVYHFYNIEGGPGQMVRVRVPRAIDKAIIPSLTPFWPGASLEERVAYDLFGVQFAGHPYHRRIYMWDEFVGHPMRKDFEKVGDSYSHFKWKGEGGEEE